MIWQDIQIAVPGFTLAAKTHGQPEQPAMLALHGWLDNANSFEWLAEQLPDYYFIALDLPGHGQSSHLPAGCHYHFSDGIFTILNAIKSLGLSKLHLLGHSMGACLASLLAGVQPDLFLSLTLIEGLGPFSSPAETACQQLRDYWNHQNPMGANPIKGYQSLAQAAKARAKRGHVSYELAFKLCERGVKAVDGHYYWQHDRRLLIPSPLRMTEAQVLSCLQDIKAPSQLIWAKQGFNFDSEEIETRMQAVPDLQVDWIEGGHHVHMENAKAIASLILAKQGS